MDELLRRLFFRLEQLAFDAAEEGEVISLKSREQLLRFFTQHPDVDFPIITLTPEGNLRARWFEDPGNTVVFEFTGEPKIKVILGIGGGVIVGSLRIDQDG